MSVNAVVVGFGLGFNTRQYHCQAIRRTEGLALHGICDVDPDRRGEAARDFGARVYERLEDVLGDGRVGLVVVATPNPDHAGQAVAALDAGKHVVVEKPMCLTTAEADAMIAAARRNRRLLTVRQSRRWDTDFLTVRNVLEQDLLGQVFSIDSALNMFMRPSSWRAEKSMGGGFLIDWGAHLVDQALILAGSPPARVFAILESRLWGVDVDTHARVLVGFRNGLQAEVEVSNISWLPRPRWHVRGERGALVYRGDQARVRTEDGERPVPNLVGNLHAFYENVAAAVNGGAEALVRPEQIRTVIAVLEAAQRSAERGEAIRLS